MNLIVCQAIKNRQLLSINYDGAVRLVIPHCHGITTAGNVALRAYQIDGYSKSGNPKGWKLFNLELANGLSVTDQHFDQPYPEYQRGDSGMSEIFCEL